MGCTMIHEKDSNGEKLKNRVKLFLARRRVSTPTQHTSSPDVETIALLITIMIKILFYVFSPWRTTEIIQLCKFICFKIIINFDVRSSPRKSIFEENL